MSVIHEYGSEDFIIFFKVQVQVQVQTSPNSQLFGSFGEV
jgi:hypothetical protein